MGTAEISGEAAPSSRLESVRGPIRNQADIVNAANARTTFIGQTLAAGGVLLLAGAGLLTILQHPPKWVQSIVGGGSSKA